LFKGILKRLLTEPLKSYLPLPKVDSLKTTLTGTLHHRSREAFKVLCGLGGIR